MRIKKRPDGRYLINISLGKGADGKTKSKSVYGRTQAEVIAKAEAFRASLKQGIYLPPNTTFALWAKKWLEVYKNNVSFNTFNMYESALRVHILPYLGDTNIDDIRKVQVQQLVNSILDAGHHRTAQITLLTIKQILASAVDSDLLIKNVAASIKIPQKSNSASKRALTKQEVRAFSNAPLSPKEKAFVFLLMYTGLRRGEVLALNVSDVRDGAVTVSKSLVLSKALPEVKSSPKSQAGNRTIPIPSIAQSALNEYLNQHSSLILFPQQKDNSKYMSASALVKFWGGIVKKVNAYDAIGSDVTMHMLRHTYASMLIEANVPIKTAQYLLGHSSIQMTMDVYAHLSNDAVDASAQIINDYLDIEKPD